MRPRPSFLPALAFSPTYPHAVSHQYRLFHVDITSGYIDKALHYLQDCRYSLRLLHPP